VDDLHAYIHRIGLHDADAVLALASGEQVRELLDTDGWTRDELVVERLDPWLAALMRAGPEILTERMLDLDDPLINWLVRQSVEVTVIDEPDDFEPPEAEHVRTPDGRLCIAFPHGAERDLPLKVFLDTLMRENAELCLSLLVHSAAALDSVLAEDAYRWRSGRMADRGYVDYYSALAIYTPPRPDQVRDARQALPKTDQGLRSERWLVPIFAPADRLANAFTALDASRIDVVQGALGYVANMALSADRVELWDEDAQRETLDRLRAGLVLGLETLVGPPDTKRDAEALAQTALSIIFRVGYGRMLEAAAPLRPALRDRLLAGPDGPVDAVDLLDLRPWAEALSARHPRRPDGQPLDSAEVLDEARHQAALLAELGRVAGRDRPLEVGVGTWLITWLARDLIGLDGPGALPAGQVERAHRALFADGALRDEARQAAAAFWGRIGGQNPFALAALLADAEDQMAAVDGTALEPRFLPRLHIAVPPADEAR
ncbi:MAG: hypothetical protein KC620_16935, partial [Myxococcales bacterium]|nr:hypothetical protein [Myxococcales bacterium]